MLVCFCSLGMLWACHCCSTQSLCCSQRPAQQRRLAEAGVPKISCLCCDPLAHLQQALLTAAVVHRHSLVQCATHCSTQLVYRA